MLMIINDPKGRLVELHAVEFVFLARCDRPIEQSVIDAPIVGYDLAVFRLFHTDQVFVFYGNPLQSINSLL